MVNFQLLGSASELVGERELRVELDEEKPIRQVLPGKPLDGDNYIVLVDGESKDLDALVYGDMKVLIMPHISGG